MPEIAYLEDPSDTEALAARLCEPVRRWFLDRFPDFTRPQKLAIPAIMDKEHLLLCSPTGSGKTLTAFLTVIDDLVRKALDNTLGDHIHCVYISPIKALANDIERNLIGPLEEIKARFLPDRAQDIRVGLRTGDTSQSDRQKMLRKPPHILITTPESMAIAIASTKFQPLVSKVRWMIIDELHSLVPTKRGVHLSLTLSNLDTLLKEPVQRIGISATMEPLETVAEYLVASDDRESRGEGQKVCIARISGSRELDLDILLSHPKFADQSVAKILESNVEVIADLISAHTTTLVFANTRKMTETLVQRLRPFLGDLVAGHHGSMDKKIRLDVERKLKKGHLRAVVTSSSLEMGIDIGSVDLVVQVGSPGDIATALQRIGRAGHHVGGIPRARFLPTSVDDLMELSALQAAIQQGDMDRLSFPQNCLDVLAQFLIGLVINEEMDMDEAYEVVVNAWSYRNLDYDDFIEVLDLLEDERRIWIDWEENTFGKRGYSRMIFYTNIGTIAPDNSYLVFNAEGSILGKLSSSFVASLRTGDVILLGGSTYRVNTIQGTRVNVSNVTGYRPTVPSWSGEARSRSAELSSAMLDLLAHCVVAVRREMDPRRVLREAYGLSDNVAEVIARHLEEHTFSTFQVPDPSRILVEQIVGGPNPTYLITTCRGRAFNTALGYFMAGLAERSGIAIIEMSFDENGLLLKTTQDVDPGAMYAAFSSGDHLEVIEQYIVTTQIFAKRFREVAGRSLIIPKRIGSEEISPQQFQQKAEALLNRHRTMDGSILIREAKNEILHGDIDLAGLEGFLNDCREGRARIVHTRTALPSRLGMSLYMSAFEDLMSMRTRAFLVKDIDPAILERLLGRRSLATEMTEEQLAEHYANKIPVPTDADGLFRLMEHGGGLDRGFDNPLYRDKLSGIDLDVIKGWVGELCQTGRITKLDGTGMEELDGKWFSPFMAEIHGTLGCLASNGGSDAEDLLNLHTAGLSYRVATAFDGTVPTAWEDKALGDPHEALRVKLVDMLGSEGPHTAEGLEERLPFPRQMVERAIHQLESRNVITIGFFTQTADAEFILKVDEHHLTGGEGEVVEYRAIQNLILDKSFTIYPDVDSAFEAHLLFQKQQELLYRIKDFRYNDWKDLQLDPDIVNGRLLQNRQGYTTRRNLPMLLGLKPEPYIGSMEADLLDRIQPDDDIQRTEIIAQYPKGDEHRQLQRDVKNGLSNLERQLLVAKQYEDVPGRRRRLSYYHRVHEVYKPMTFQDALCDVITRIGPIKAGTLRFYVTRSYEELLVALKELENDGRISRVTALVPDPEDFYCAPDEVDTFHRARREDRELRILTQSDPYVSRFIWEVRAALDRGWYLPVFKGIDPVGKVLMFKVNDYLEVKDIHIPAAYLEEFCAAFDHLLNNHADQLVDVAVLTNVNGEPVSELDDTWRNALEGIGFRGTGERMIRGGIVETQPRQFADRALFHKHHLHQQTRLENEILALKQVREVRDDFALRGRAEVYRVDLKSMASANRLHQGVNLNGHQVWASYEHFQTLLSIRGLDPDEDLLDILEFFSSHSDHELLKERYAISQSEFRKLVQPLVRSGHIVQDFRGGFRTVQDDPSHDRVTMRKEYLRELVSDFPIMTIKQLLKLAGSYFKPDEVKSILTEFEQDGTLIKGFLIDDLHEVCWGRKDLLDAATELPPMRDFVLPPSDPLAPYFAGTLKERFGFGSAYLVFRNGEPAAAFKANTRNKIIEVTDYEGIEEAWRIVKEFAWEHQMPLTSDVRIGGRKLSGNN
jgi:ATP-dependent Lhr-like helicase